MNEDQEKAAWEGPWEEDPEIETEEFVDPLETLVERAREDPSAPFEAIVELRELRSADPPAYERLRRALIDAGFRRVTALERLMGAQGSEQGGEDSTQATVLLRLATDGYAFNTPEDVGHVDVMVNGHRETYPILGKRFKRYLRYQYLQSEGSAPSAEALNAALNTIDARAVFEGHVHQVYTRIANLGDRVYVDLGNAAHQVVAISSDGWKVLDVPPDDVRFRRAAGMHALPVPERGGSLEPLKKLMHLTTQDEFVLTIAWLIAAIFGRGPFPVMVLVAEQGSAKSTRARMLRGLVDPHEVPIRSPFREMREAHIAAKNSYVIAIDNLSALSQWMSDLFCCIATGGGNTYRTLYSDEDETLFSIRRPQIINGIEDVAVRADLADRSLHTSPAPISEDDRRPEDELWAEFEKVRPSVLGALFDLVAHGLGRIEEINAKKLPRMADFMKLMLACETALWAEGTFESVYARNLEEVTAQVLAADHVATAVRELMSGKDRWEGTPTELLTELEAIVGERPARSKNWPDNAHVLSSRLRRAASNLRKIGIEITQGLHDGTKSRRRRILIQAQGEPTTAQPNGHAADAADANSGQETPRETTVNRKRPRGAGRGHEETSA